MKRTGVLVVCFRGSKSCSGTSYPPKVHSCSGQRCGSSRKLVILFIVSSCYCFRARGIVCVVCSIVLSKGSKPFM